MAGRCHVLSKTCTGGAGHLHRALGLPKRLCPSGMRALPDLLFSLRLRKAALQAALPKQHACTA
eukprot:scaffold205880_cov18-Tisochrysis_lutea.AAC.1